MLQQLVEEPGSALKMPNKNNYANIRAKYTN